MIEYKVLIRDEIDGEILSGKSFSTLTDANDWYETHVKQHADNMLINVELYEIMGPDMFILIKCNGD